MNISDFFDSNTGNKIKRDEKYETDFYLQVRVHLQELQCSIKNSILYLFASKNFIHSLGITLALTNNIDRF